MLYKIETKGIDRIVIAKIDAKLFEAVQKLTGSLPIYLLTDKGKKKIDLSFETMQADMPVVKFKIHKTATLEMVESIISIAEETLKERMTKPG
ncbi:MAG: hypothetical protein WC139_07165 [Candidatus Kapaibacterium sp.]